MNLSAPTVRTISVILVTPPDRSGLNPALESLVRQDFPSLETIVVGMEGSEGLAKFLRDYDLNASCLAVEDDNYCAARNAGAREATGDLLLFMKGTSELPHSNTLARIMRYFRTNDAAAASFRLIDGSDQEIEWYRWDGPGDGVTGRESPVLHPAAAAVRSKMFERVGGFWDGYNRELAFKDLAARIIIRNGPVRFCPSVSVRDRSPRQPFRLRLEGLRYRIRNRILFAVRTFSLPRAVWWGLRETLGAGGAIYRQPAAWRSWLSGMVLAWKDLPEAWRTREVAAGDHIRRILGRYRKEGDS